MIPLLGGAHRAVALILIVLLIGCERPPRKEAPEFQLRPVQFSELPGWSEDRHAEALRAFLVSCTALAKRPPSRPMGADAAFGTVADWQILCRDARVVGGHPEAARRFFESRFVPYRASDGADAEGLFTGYFEPLLRGARNPHGPYRWPLYRRPNDLVTAELGQFDPQLEGMRIAGRVQDGRFVPYFDRAAIDGGALVGRRLELLWVDDPIDRFFLEIQGSGQVALPDGTRTRVGFADQNGRSYRAIGRDLVEMGALAQEEVSLQSIRAWLEANPDRAFEIMHKNPSVVFFRELPELADSEGPLGAMNVPLTPGRSLAVDRRFVPLGVPIWLVATAPFPEGERPLRRLMVAQDTGGAIKGPVRGDVFWGSGALAEHVAGHMRSRGSYYLLLPRELAPTS